MIPRRTAVAVLAIASLVAAAGCSSREPLSRSAPFVHVVFFKAKSGAPEADAAEIQRDVNEMLASLPTVKGLWLGRPAPTNTRPIVDTNYDVGLLLLFEDQKGLQDYLDHPRHAEFARKHDTRCDVRVFDFVPAAAPAALSVPSASPAGEEEGFVPLFAEGPTPEGWLVRAWDDIAKPAGDASWKVADGILHGSEQRGTWLVSEREYSDFVLRYEFKLGSLGNGGCALRAPLRGDPAFDGMEFQMADFRYNPEAKDSELTGGIYRAIAPLEQVYKPTEWNVCEISLQGSRLRAVLNGEVIHDLDLDEQGQEVKRHDGSLAPVVRDRPRKGHIGFQELSRGDERVQIRKARIKVLDRPAAAGDRPKD